MSPKQPSWRDRFFEERRLTSQLKHLVLRDYVREFAYHLGSESRPVYYIDGFAGPGQYRAPGRPPEDGSPLLIAKLAEQIRASANPFELRCLNVEKVPTSHQRLQDATAAFRPQIVEHNYRSTFAEAIPDVLQRIGRSPSFFFIDPFGTKDIPFDALEVIFARDDRTEVLITFHADGIAKKAGYFDSFDSPDARKASLARALTANLSAALALDLEELRARWNYHVNDNQGGTDAFELNILTHYRTLLTSSRTRFAFTKPFPVRYDPTGLSAGGSSVCFYLVFAAQKQKGLEVMNDVMTRALHRLYRDAYSHTLFPDFDTELNERNIALLAEEIADRFRGRTFSIDVAKTTLMQESMLLVRSGGYRNAVLTLKKAGRLRQLSQGPLKHDSPLRIQDADQSRLF